MSEKPLIVDVPYCSSSFLMYRTVVDSARTFCEALPPRLYVRDCKPKPIHNSRELASSLKEQVERATIDGKAAIALSGGIDSAVLARYMPRGSKAYTFKCVVDGVEVTDEVPQAARYAEECGLDHEVVEISWEDMTNLAPELMRHKGAPIHSIEVQIAKAALKAHSAGFERIIFGESADVNYGGQSGLFSGTWTFGQWVDRYSYVLPYRVLRDYRMVTEPCSRYCRDDGYIDVLEFCRDYYFSESMGSYENATSWGGINLVAPYANTWLAEPLDYERIRRGENKYLVREVFGELYPGWSAPTKTPMPRPTEEWLADWKGPTRPEFWPNCVNGMTGDQKWLLWSLEQFLNILDEVK